MNLLKKSNYSFVSVIIPTYNRKNLIARSIQSVLNQSYKDFEVIIIDDASIDGTQEIVETFSDKRLKYYRLKDRKGAGSARNIGIKKSNGSFITFLDSDDVWLPKKLEKQLLVFQNESPKIGVVYTDMQRILKNGTIKYYPAPTIVPERLINPITKFYQVRNIGIQSVVIKKECFEQVGYFNERLPRLEDLELFIRLSKRYIFYHIQEPLVKYYETKGISTNTEALYLARELLLRLNFKELIKSNKKFLLKEYVTVLKGKYHNMPRKKMHLFPI